MALLYEAELRPTKLELVNAWAPTQPWYAGVQGELSSVGAYRFDDPAGEVGVETLLVQAPGSAVMQIPLTYRGAPLVDADEWLITTMQHSVLGARWVYDAVGDPVYLQTLAAAIISAGTQADLYVDVDGVQVKRQPSASVIGSGIDGVALPALPTVDEITVQNGAAETVVQTSALRFEVRRVIDASRPAAEADGTLSGTWTGQADPQPLVYASVR